MHPFLLRLREILKYLDDEALAAMANRGLLRRAQKDLESARPAIVAVDDASVRLQVAECVVVVPELPSKSACTCPATTVCRHIISALLFLRDDGALAAEGASASAKKTETASKPPAKATNLAAAPPDVPSAHSAAAQPTDSPSMADVLAAASEEDLRKWAGKALLRKAERTLAGNPKVEIEEGPALVVRFPTRNVTCRWLPSGGLAGVICSCQSQTVCEHAVSAVLALQAARGKRQAAAAAAALEASSGAPRSRAEVLASVGAVLREMLSLGLSRISQATAQRLATLAVSSHGVDLPRMERMLKTLADEVQHALRRDARSSSVHILHQAARAEALRAGLAGSGAPGLVGQHRTQYHEVGQITLLGLGARRWRSKAGYHGLTVYFWDESTQSFATWSDARPLGQMGFEPLSRYRGDGPWSGCPSPAQASRSVLRLSGAYRNAQGRLSGRAGTRAQVQGTSNPRELPECISDWSELAERAARLFGGGLDERSEALEIVVLAPRGWTEPQYDSLRQELLRGVSDTKGRLLTLWLPFTPENENAIGLLEHHDPAQTYGLLGLLRLVNGRLRVQPVSLFTGELILNLNLDESDQREAKRSTRRSSPPAAPPPSPLEEESTTDLNDDALEPTAATPLGRLLATAQAELEAIAESGLGVRRDLELLRSAAKRMEALGLTTCAAPLACLVDHLAAAGGLAAPETRAEAAARLLHVYYVLRLAAEQETITLACTGLA